MNLSVFGLIPEASEGQNGYLTDTCTSTMDIAWSLFGQGLFSDYTFVLAKNQTRGRGQFGREWVSDSGNLFATIRIPDSARVLDNLLPMAMALCVVMALETLTIPAQIKWPNDIMTGYSKVGGILIEKKGPVVMAGIGLNIGSAPESSPGEKFFQIKAGCLKESGVNLNPCQVWTQILEQIRCRLPGMVAAPSTVAENVQRRLALAGDPVVLENTGDTDGPARILGIDPQGSLIIETIKGIKTINRGRIYPRIE